jgi:hypothetical protein
MERQLPQVTVHGQQIANGRIAIINRGVEVLLADARKKQIDWNSHDLLISIVPKVLVQENL